MKKLTDYVKDFTLMQNADLLSGRTLTVNNILFFAVVEFEPSALADLIYLYACTRAGYCNELQEPQAVAIYSKRSHCWIFSE